MVCLDTDILIDILRNEKNAIKKISELKKNSKLSTTSINSFELFKGALRSKQKDALEGLNGLLATLEILDFDFEASKKAAEIFEELRVKGETLDPSDLMVATIALISNESILTRNIKHFEKISSLRLEKI